jgi:hypothetical protein
VSLVPFLDLVELGEVGGGVALDVLVEAHEALALLQLLPVAVGLELLVLGGVLRLQVLAVQVVDVGVGDVVLPVLSPLDAVPGDLSGAVVGALAARGSGDASSTCCP